MNSTVMQGGDGVGVAKRIHVERQEKLEEWALRFEGAPTKASISRPRPSGPPRLEKTLSVL